MKFLGVRAWQACEAMLARANELRIEPRVTDSGTTIIDCGVDAAGGLEAGCCLAEVCMSRLARITLTPGNSQLAPGPLVAVATDHPSAACLRSQYAGWRISRGKYFAMGSGPMRAAYGGEELFNDIGGRERPPRTVGVLETSALPDDEVCREIAKSCGVNSQSLMLLAARTKSLAGSLQIVARSVETALHKLHELKFDVQRIQSAWGTAPLPPPATDDMAAIGRTNDAILYGADVTLWVRGDDESIAAIGSKTPSSGSHDFGRPFEQIFREANYDFYKIDPLLFSPARVAFVNITTGRTQIFGELRPDILKTSFG